MTKRIPRIASADSIDGADRLRPTGMADYSPWSGGVTQFVFDGAADPGRYGTVLRIGPPADLLKHLWREARQGDRVLPTVRYQSGSPVLFLVIDAAPGGGAARAAKGERVMYDTCVGAPGDLVDANLCLDALSKDARGEMFLVQADKEECRDLDCTTLTAIHAVRLEVTGHACDGRLGALLDGALAFRNLVTVFANADGQQRGLHSGDFIWATPAGVRVHGSVSGMTNVGTHREPVFDPACQRCDDRGVMEGRFCGQVVRTPDPSLARAQLFGVYRLRFDPSSGAVSSGMSGVIEGVVVRECQREPRCIDFLTPGTGPNPRQEGDATIHIRDLSGPVANSQIVTWGNQTGLHVWHATTLEFAAPVSQVEVTLVHFVQPATVSAFDASGVQLASVTMTAPQGVPEQLVLAGAGIVRVEIHAPQDEVLMPRLCVR